MTQLAELRFWLPKPPSLACVSCTALPALPSEGWGRRWPLHAWLRAAAPEIGLQCSCLSLQAAEKQSLRGGRGAKQREKANSSPRRARRQEKPRQAAWSRGQVFGSWRHRGAELLRIGRQAGCGMPAHRPAGRIAEDGGCPAPRPQGSSLRSGSRW